MNRRGQDKYGNLPYVVGSIYYPMKGVGKVNNTNSPKINVRGTVILCPLL
jgi:hypothetical protein